MPAGTLHMLRTRHTSQAPKQAHSAKLLLVLSTAHQAGSGQAASKQRPAASHTSSGDYYSGCGCGGCGCGGCGCGGTPGSPAAVQQCTATWAAPAAHLLLEALLELRGGLRQHGRQHLQVVLQASQRQPPAAAGRLAAAEVVAGPVGSACTCACVAVSCVLPDEDSKCTAQVAGPGADGGHAC
jgi:hypothetical protein